LGGRDPQAGGPHHQDLPKDLRFAVIVTGDTIIAKRERGEPLQDTSGETAVALVGTASYRVTCRIYLPNDEGLIRSSVIKAAEGADVILVIGGTGIGKRDVTVEAISPILLKVLPGFGELFRHLSFESVGPSTIASRAMAGVLGDALVFALPGSTGAVRLALERIILPEAPHLLKMVRHRGQRAGT